MCIEREKKICLGFHPLQESAKREFSQLKQWNFIPPLGYYFCSVDDNEHQVDWLPTPWQSLVMPKVLGTFLMSAVIWKKCKVTAFSSPHPRSPVSGQVTGLTYLFTVHFLLTLSNRKEILKILFAWNELIPWNIEKFLFVTCCVTQGTILNIL